MTLTGSIMGTAQYLSPEQAQGYAVSETSDIYSVGVILYELLSGVVPFEGDSAVAIAYKQVAAEPRPPSEINPALPPELDAIVLHALAKDPAGRYASAGELIAVLERERQALPAYSAAMAGSGGGYGSSGPGDNPHGTGALLMAPAVRGNGYGPLPEEERRRRWMWWVLGTVLLAVLVALALILLRPSNSKVHVPNVVGRSEQGAGAALRRAGLNPVPSLASSMTVPTGLVISENPAAGTLVKKGSRVNIRVSGGPASAALPSVEGLSASQAVAKLRKAGFKPTTKSQPSTTVPDGKVIGTDPPAGTELQLASNVTVLVSSGPEAVRGPARHDRRSRACPVHTHHSAHPDHPRPDHPDDPRHPARGGMSRP